MKIESITQTIRKFLDEKGIKQETVARKMGVSEQQLSRWLNGNDLKFSTIQNIADALEIKISVVFDENIITFNEPNEKYGKSSVNNEFIDFLKEELKEKNEIIKKLIDSKSNQANQ